MANYWVLFVMDPYTRRIIGLAVHARSVDRIVLRRMFHQAIEGQHTPKYLSTDHNPLYKFHHWRVNVRMLDITEIKTQPLVPLSHPFVERRPKEKHTGLAGLKRCCESYVYDTHKLRYR